MNLRQLTDCIIIDKMEGIPETPKDLAYQHAIDFLGQIAGNIEMPAELTNLIKACKFYISNADFEAALQRQAEREQEQ